MLFIAISKTYRICMVCTQPLSVVRVLHACLMYVACLCAARIFVCCPHACSTRMMACTVQTCCTHATYDWCFHVSPIIITRIEHACYSYPTYMQHVCHLNASIKNCCHATRTCTDTNVRLHYTVQYCNNGNANFIQDLSFGLN